MSLAANHQNVPCRLCTLVILFFSLLIPVPGYPQTLGGTILGTVTDPSGAVVPEVQISIKNMATGTERKVTTNTKGFYTVPSLLPGEYTITATAAGFMTQVRSGITLTVGLQQVVNLQLAIGKTTQAVAVTGAAPTVELASSTISGLVNAHTIVELPLNGRDWTQLGALQPGVHFLAAQVGQLGGPSAPGGRMVRGDGVQMTISGGRPEENNYLLDGININDYANSAPGSALGVNLGVDAVQQFSLMTTNYSAEYGRTTGGIFEAVTRAGTNALHGDVYEFLRNDSLDASDFISNEGGIPKPPLRQNQFGASLGGPIKKDRTFFFGDYEGFRQVVGATALDTVPTAAARAGNLCSNPGTPPVCTPTTVTVSPAVKPYLALYPLPNGTILPGGDVGNFALAAPGTNDEDYFTARIDHTFSEKDSLDGTYLYDNANGSSPDEFDNKPNVIASRRQLVSLNEVHVFSPRLVNTARVGVSRTAASHGIVTTVFNPLLKDLSLGFIPGQAIGIIGVAGITGFSGGLGLDDGDIFRYTSIQAYDDLYFTKGIHSLKMGANVERVRNNQNSPAASMGDWEFNSLSDFLTNVPFTFNGPLPGSNSNLGLRQTIVGAYILDNMRLRTNLTLNLGLRYEMATIASEVHGLSAPLFHLTDPQPTVGPYFLGNPTLHNFEPRVGFAWDPFKNGKTSIRGGFGIFNLLPMTFMFHQFTDSAPFFKGGQITTPPGTFPTGGFTLLGPTSSRPRAEEAYPHSAYRMEWNFNVQRQITPTAALTVAFVGSRGVHMPWLNNWMNTVIPTITPQGAIFPQPPSPAAVPLNPNVSRINALYFQGNNFYDSLQVGLTKRLSHGLQAQVSYTWSKSIDDVSGMFDAEEFNNSVNNPLPFDVLANRAVSDYNVPQNLVISSTYVIPSPSSWSGPLALLAKGWQLGGILTVQDGTPFTPLIAGDQAGSQMDGHSAQRPIFNPIPGCSTDAINPGNFTNYIKTQCLLFPPVGVIMNSIGRNTLTGPGEANLDFSLFKNIPVRRISENFHAQFRVETFNLLNRPNLTGPFENAMSVFDGSGNIPANVGQITDTQTTAREIQFGLKLIW